MKTLVRLIKKEFIRFLNDRTAVLLTFFVPMVLIYLFGTIFGGSGGTVGKPGVIFVNNSNSHVAAFLEQKLDSSKSINLKKTYWDEPTKSELALTDTMARNMIIKGDYSAAIIFPEDFFADTSSGLKIKIYFDPKNEIETNLIQGAIQQSMMGQMGKLFPILISRKTKGILGNDKGTAFVNEYKGIVGEYFSVNFDSLDYSFFDFDSSYLFSPDTGQAAGNNMMSGMIDFEREQLVGEDIENPQVARIIGGWAMMFLLFSLSGAATSFFEEKSDGTLRRLLCMPIQRDMIIWSKFVYSVLLGFIQLSVLFLFGWILFDVDIFSNLLNLIVVIFVSAGAAVAFGMIITVVSDSISQASGYSTFLILVMSVLGGAWFPTFFFPDWLQVVSKFTLVYWAVEAFQNVLWRQSGLLEILPHLLILGAVAIIVNLIAVYKFKNGKMMR